MGVHCGLYRIGKRVLYEDYDLTTVDQLNGNSFDRGTINFTCQASQNHAEKNVSHYGSDI